ncbi:MAG: tetratricopeptide repeat protein [Methanospirillum sp.]|uniref:tetratricopeptide repeat protein n=1 Tax=Methanospirillum sp. TaxID=45200 RepID=UPI00237578C0|nr:tetratricopeptide repeat protein [Methanospirillum sp.]MDD1727518.1 tetratricopeptide repeat protein [Methanospirillum sp.]
MKIRDIASIMALALLLCLTAGVSSAENTSTTQLFEMGNQSIQQEKWEDAITAFKQVVELDPQDSTAWFKLGGSYFQNGNVSDAYYAYQNATTINPEYGNAQAMVGFVLLYGMVPPDAAGAVTALEKAVSLIPDDTGVKINYGIANLLTGNSEAAQKTFEELTQADPKNERAWYWLGVTRSDSAKLEEGLEAYNKAVEINPEYKDAWFAKADVEGYLGKQNESETSFNTLLSIKGDYAEPFKTTAANDAEVYYRLGVIQFNNNNLEDAAKNFDKSIELDATNHNAWYYKGRIQFENNDLAGARTSLDKAIALKPEFANALYWKARVDIRDNQYPVAIEELINATTIDSNLTDAWYFLGGIQGDSGSFEDAAASFTKLTELRPEFADAWYFKGLDEYQLLKLTETKDSLEHALNLTSDTFTPDMQANAWWIVGLINTENGDTEAAASAFNQSVAQNGTFSGAWNAYGTTLNDLKKYDEALAAIEQALSIDKDTSEYWYNKGNIQRNMNKTEDALKSYDEAITIEPEPRVWNSKGMALMQLGQDDKAVEAFDSGLKLDETLAVLWFNKAGALYNLGKFTEASEAVEKALALDSSYEAAINLKEQLAGKEGSSADNSTSVENNSTTSSSETESFNITPENLNTSVNKVQAKPTLSKSDFSSLSEDNSTSSEN